MKRYKQIQEFANTYSLEFYIMSGRLFVLYNNIREEYFINFMKKYPESKFII